jgi:putative transcriptional regulator
VKAPTHHLPEALLIGFATGTGDEIASLVGATHVHMCDVCQAAVAEIESLGGAILEALPPSEVSPGVLDAVMARLDRVTPPPSPPPEPLPAFVPAPLAPYVREAGGVDWKWVLPGVHKIELGLSIGDRPVQLIRFRAGLDIGLHKHEGNEIAVVLQGGFSDAAGHYVQGDVAVVDQTVTHHPHADDDGEDCILLVAAEGASLPQSTLGKLVAKIVRF